MNTKAQFNWINPAKDGLIGGVIALLVVLVGIVEAFSKRAIIGGVISMGHTLLAFGFVYAGYRALSRLKKAQHELGTPPNSPLEIVLSGGIAGLVVALMLAILVIVGPAINLRAMFINASPGLYSLLTFGMGGAAGLIVLLIFGAGLGALTATTDLLPAHIRRAVLLGIFVIVFVGLLQDLLRVMLDGWGVVGYAFTWMFATRGLSIVGTIVLFILCAGGNLVWQAQNKTVKTRLGNLSPAGQRNLRWGSLGLLVIVMLVLPHVIGSYPSEVIDMVGIFTLMGLGLNIVVGFAGLLDLGYVAFFAIGAYIMGVLTSPEITFLPFRTTFWVALPISVLGALTAGIVLGVPVLGMRGDYLAIVTLGFGEIIRLVALSDWLKPYIGGSNGITRIPKAVVGPVELGTPQTLYYLVILACLLAAFVSSRLKDSRMGRAWMAMREDEDVAEAVGIHLVSTKLLAFASGAAFSGLAGAIFASKLTSIYPHSFDLMKSINALCLIIVGGMGSIPGVIVGALILVGVPELLKEFADYRMLMYGALLVIMMLTKPEGFWPEATHRRELHEEEEEDINNGNKANPALAQAGRAATKPANR